MTETLSDNPRDYGVPFDAWYVNQRELAKRAVNLGDGKVLVIQSPVGSGKSVLPAVVSHFRPHTFSLMGTRELQAQYAHSLPVFTILWGQEWYECVDKRWSAYIGKYNRKATRADCPHSTYPGRGCKTFDACPYELAKARVLGARAVATNYACAWHVDWWKPICVDVFADEAHTLPEHVLNLATTEIDAETRKAFNLQPFPLIERDKQHKEETYSLFSRWLSSAIKRLESVAKEAGYGKFGMWARRTKQRLENLTGFITGAEEGAWFIQTLGTTLRAEPVHPRPFVNRIIPLSARSTVLMSATIGKPDVLLKRLGLDGGESEFISVPHPFPRDNRPVFFITRAPRMNYRSGDRAYALQADIIADIMDKHKGEKGIIHTASWRHATRLAVLLSKRGQENRLFLPRGKRVEKVDEFKRAPMGTIAISPSWAEGLDFVGEAGTLSVTAKVPFKPIGSPVEKFRLSLPGGNDEYRQDAANKVAQQSGRIVRTPTDVGVTYIVDANWELVKEDAPDWFETENL